MLILREDTQIFYRLILEVNGLMPFLQFRVVGFHIVEELSEVHHFCLVIIECAELPQLIVSAIP